MNESGKQCPICNYLGGKHFSLEYYSKNGSINTSVYYCKNCGIYWREFPEAAIVDNHFQIAGYTDLKQEDSWKEKRFKFFSQIIGLLGKYNPGPEVHSKVLLDFGCSYGHFMDMASSAGYKCIGIETVDYLREKLAGKYETYKTLDSVKDNSVDVITSIDSLYYVREPYEAMKQFSRILNTDGILLFRITNRVNYIKTKELLGKKISPQEFGDCMISFNDKSIRMLAQKTGFKIEKTIYREEKPQRKELLLKIGYGLFPYICEITGLKLTPGLMYVLRRVTSRPIIAAGGAERAKRNGVRHGSA